MRRGVLLGLAAFLAATTVVFSGPSGGVQAQSTPTANADGSYTVAPDWALTPSGIGPGQKFRLLFRSSTFRNAQSTDIADYNTHVQTAAASGHAAIQPYSSTFKVVGCTSAVNAKVNTGTDSGTGEPIYWLNGVKVVDNYAGFYDGTWDNQSHNNVHTEAGSNPPDNRWPYTGCGNDGTSSTTPLGNGGQVTQGNPGTGGQSLNTGTTTPNNRTNLGFYALSPVFVVRLSPPTEVTHIGINAVVGGNVVTDDVVTVQETDGDLVFQVRHALEPESQHGIGADLTFNYYVHDDLDYRPGWHVHPGYKSVVWPAGQPSLNVTVPVRANADGHDGDNRVRIVLMAGNGYFGVKGNLTYHIQDGPDTPPNRISHKISIEPVNPGTEVTEGEPARFRIRLRGPSEAGVPFTVHLKVEDSGGYVAAAHEGQEAIFLITADPAPPSDLGVSVTVTATGDFGVETGTRTVIIPSEGFAALKLDTINDDNDEPNGSVTLVINPDTGYTVGPFSTYTQSIVDDDEPGLVVDQMQSVDEQLPADHPRVRYSSLVASLYGKIGEQTDDQWKIYKGRWKRVLKAFGHPEFVDHQAPAYTAAEARKMHSPAGPPSRERGRRSHPAGGQSENHPIALSRIPSTQRGGHATSTGNVK